MRRVVGQAHAAIWIVLVMWFVAGTNVVSARAVEESGRASVSRSAQSSQRARPVAEEEEDDDDESFFSGSTNSKIATASPMTSPVVSSAPRVDVVATCQAVLADNQSYYHARFLEGCRRVVAQNGRR